MNEQVKTAVRTLGCLEVLATTEDGMSLVDLARVLDAPKSSLLMLLRTLVDLGYVERDANERYVVNPSLRGDELGWIGGPHALLLRNAHPVMRALTEEIRETCFLSVVTPDHWLRLLAKIVSPREIRYDMPLSQRLAPHKTASGRAQLAHWRPDALAEYIDAWATRDGVPGDQLDEWLLAEQIARIRSEGVALLVDEWVAGATGISAPIFDVSGAPIGAVTVGAVTARFLADRDEIVEAVKRAGADITANLPDRLRRGRTMQPNGGRAEEPAVRMGEEHALS